MCICVRVCLCVYVHVVLIAVLLIIMCLNLFPHLYLKHYKQNAYMQGEQVWLCV